MLQFVSRPAWAACVVALFSLTATAQTTALLEDFEDDTVTYTTSPAAEEFNDGDEDFFTRTDGSDIASAYSVSGFNGSFFFAVQDTDADGEAKVQNLVFSGIDVSGLTDLRFSALFAEDDDGSNEDWDDTSDDNFVRVYATVDGGAEQFIFAIEGSNAGAANGAPRVDEDFNGVGEGTEVTDTFALFNAPISGTGATLTLRIETNLEDGDEDIAIDDVTVTGVRGPAIALQTFVAQADEACTDPDDIETCTVPESSSTTADAGEKIVVRYSVENTGDVTLTTHDLVDTDEGVILNDFAFDLTPSLTVFLDVFGTAPATPGTATRGATWTADDGGSAVAIGTSTYEITVAPPPTACTTTSPLYISAFAIGSPGGVTVTNSSTTDTVGLPDCTLAVFDGISELVTATETAPAPLPPAASYPYTPDVPAGPGAVIVSTAALEVDDEVSDAAETVVAAVVYDASGAVFGECGRGPAGAQGGDLDPCDSDAGAASVSAALAALFGGAVASEDGAGLDLALTVAPNPTLGRTAIAFGLAEAGDARVAVFDALGREVALLLKGARGAGRHEAMLDASVLPAGVYVLRVTAGTDVRTTRFTVAR